MLLYISQHPTGLKGFKTENHKITNSDGGNVELSSNFQNLHVINPFQVSFPF